MITYTVVIMLKSIIFTLATLAAGIAAAPTFGPFEQDDTDLIKRQHRFATQYWANDKADLDWVSGPAGAYSVNWTNPSGGNFVVGKGYFGQGM